MKNRKLAVIILPTFNEAKNIRSLIEKIDGIRQQINSWYIYLLVVDDNSPDGTGAIVQEMIHTIPHISLITGDKEGLGKAYTRGFQWVLEHYPTVDYVLQMDADLSHNPDYIIDFLREAGKGYDVIIGSRYIQGGGCPDWKWYRKFVSRLGNLYIHLIGGIKKIHDCTSGYRCISLSFIRKVNFSRLTMRGYSFLFCLLHQIVQLNATMKEIPILFTDRTKGQSKLGVQDILEDLMVATTLRWRKYKPEEKSTLLSKRKV